MNVPERSVDHGHVFFALSRRSLRLFMEQVWPHYHSRAVLQGRACLLSTLESFRQHAALNCHDRESIRSAEALDILSLPQEGEAA